MKTKPVVKTIREIRSLYPKSEGYVELEAEEPLSILVPEAMIPFAKQNSLDNCPLAWGIKVNVSADVVPYILRSAAYLVDRTAKTITRYRLSCQAANMVEHYDRTGEFLPGLYVLVPFPPSGHLVRKPAGRPSRGTRKQVQKSALVPRRATSA